MPHGVSVIPEPSSTLERPKSQILSGVKVLFPNTRFSGWKQTMGRDPVSVRRAAGPARVRAPQRPRPPYLDVPVHNAIVVQVLDASGHLHGDADRIVLGEAVDVFNALEKLAAAHPARRPVQQVPLPPSASGTAGDQPRGPHNAQLHDQVVVFARLEKVDELNNVGVVQPLVNRRLTQQVLTLSGDGHNGDGHRDGHNGKGRNEGQRGNRIRIGRGATRTGTST